MASRATTHVPASPTRPPRASVLLLLALALVGHLYAAHAIGGSRTAYGHHVAGFVVILLVTGAPLALLGRRFWPTQAARTTLAIAVVQAAAALWIALAPSSATMGP